MIPPNQFNVRERDKVNAVRYYESISRNYEGVVNSGFLAYLRERERTEMLRALELDEVDEFGLSKVQNLIDVGCGSGYYALEAKRQGLQVTVIDASQGMINRLASQVDQAIVGDIEKYHGAPRYDRVVCAGVLDFVSDPERAFENLTGLLSDHGKLIVLVPIRGFWSLFYQLEKKRYRLEVNLFTLEWFEHMAKCHDLILTFSSKPLPYNLVLRFERKRSPG